MKKKPSIIWDSHGCFALRNTAELYDLKRYKKAGVDFLSINIGMDFNPLNLIIEVLAGFRKYIIEHPDYVLAKTYSDVENAINKHQMAIAFDLEGSVMLQDNPAMVSFFYDLGVRQMLLAYNNDNTLSGGCLGNNRGLTPLGRAVIQEMNRVGMTLDLSHMSPRSTLEAMDICEKPVIFSHSNAKTICNHPRNITDEQIKACAAKDGVVGVNGIGTFVSSNVETSTPRVVDHIDYIAQLVGPRHVGIGLDFVADKEELKDFLENHPEVFEKLPNTKEELLRFSQPEQIAEIPEELEKRGYPSDAISAIMGLNFARIAKTNWK